MDDHQLLRAYFEGDERAFETVVEKYFRMVYTVAARQTGDSHLAEEVAQSVFLVLSRKAHGLSSQTSIPGWLLRTTRFVCRDAIKMRRRRDEKERMLAVNLEHEHGAKREPNAMELLLEEAIQVLQPEEQASIVARFFEGKDYQEMAVMLAITEEAARKRTTRCLAKLKNWMSRRGARVSSETLCGLLMTQAAQDASHETLRAAVETAHAVWKGKIAAPKVAALAEHAIQLLRWRLLGALGVKLVLPVLVLCLGIWSVRQWDVPQDRIEKLGKAWSALVQQVARHRQFLAQTNPNTPNYQATVQEQLGAISRESGRIIGELNPLLGRSDERSRLAQFLTAEMGQSLELDAATKTNVLIYLQNHLAGGATLKDAMKTLAEATPAETPEIKAMLSPAQQQQFDRIYGADGVLLFTYPKIIALGKLGI